MQSTFLRPSEKAVYDLRELYLHYGYRHYKVSRFEEYDLYAKNKSFLADKNILTFTDTDGRLMALKPDVTLSIIKNTKTENGIQKVFYNEQVYRTNGSGFCEIVQTGLECIGDIDLYSMAEVITLAYKSLEKINDDFIIDLSHMGFLTGIIEEISTDESVVKRLLLAAGDKNIAEIKNICGDSEMCDVLCEAVMLYGKPDDCLDKMRGMIQNNKMRDAWQELSEIVSLVGDSDKLRIDFSVINDMKYYNGIIFKGFINGISKSVLSGGRYDNLMMCMGKKSGAVGFAVYLDELDRLLAVNKDTDIDVLLVYDDKTSPSDVTLKISELVSKGLTVRAQKGETTDCRYGELVNICGGGTNVR